MAIYAVVEIQNNKRSRGAKNDRIDTVQAARTALAQTEQATPRDRGLREALRQVLVTRQGILMSRTQGDQRTEEFDRRRTRASASPAERARVGQAAGPDRPVLQPTRSHHRVTVRTLRSIAAGIRFLINQAAELDDELLVLIPQHPAGPALLAEPGVGPVVAAQLLVSWSHRGRVRNEAAFASLARVAPREASSGQRTRHRLSRMGEFVMGGLLVPSAVAGLGSFRPGRR